MHVLTRAWAAAFAAMVGFLAPTTSWAEDPFEIVHFQSLTFDGEVFQPLLPAPEQGKPATVFGMLRLPSGTERVPAVVVLHGCWAITAAETQTAIALTGKGIATFVVNSFTGRELPSICKGFRTINMSSVVTDAYRALALLAGHPRVDPSRIAVLGFAFGGRAALWAGHPRFRENYGAAGQRFAAHLAFYPAACFIELADENRIDAPIRIFHGSADDWTPVAPCRDYVARLRGMGKDIALFEYEGARHSFVYPYVNPVNEITAISFAKCSFVERDGYIVDRATGSMAGYRSPCVTQSATVGRDSEARRRAIEDVETFLAALFQMK
jgi:dienelactone hydrolase